MAVCKECGCGFVTIVDGAVLGDVCDHCQIRLLRAELEEALDIVECVAHGLKREPHQLQFDAVALLKKRQTTSA